MRSQGKPSLALASDEEGDMGEPSDAARIIASGATLQRTQVNYTGAIQVQKPRVLKTLARAVQEEAALVGEDFYYAWTVNDKNSPTGKSLIEGVSVDGAMIIARNWGNCAIPVELEVDAPTHWVLRATFLDLETGFNVARLFRQRKSQSASKKMDADRSLDIAFQIGQSKAQRNVITKAMPAWLLSRAMRAAKAAAEEAFKEVEAAAPKLIAKFAKIRVTQEMLEARVGRPASDWLPADLAMLDAIGRALKNKETTVANEFSPPEEVKDDANGPDGEKVGGGEKVVDGELIDDDKGAEEKDYG